VGNGVKFIHQAVDDVCKDISASVCRHEGSGLHCSCD
jgi:hypothetical protein